MERIRVDLSINKPDIKASDAEIKEWLDYNLYAGCSISLNNPLIDCEPEDGNLTWNVYG